MQIFLTTYPAILLNTFDTITLHPSAFTNAAIAQ